MTAIAGIAFPDNEQTVNQMLARMAHRGSQGQMVRTINGLSLGLSWPAGQADAGQDFPTSNRISDYVSDSHYAWAKIDQGSFTLSRDPLGISPLYYGFTKNNVLCFSSEVKGLLENTDVIHEIPPGSEFKEGSIHESAGLFPQQPVDEPRLQVAAELRRRLEKSVKKRVDRGVPFGAWLSGGLDSSIMAALARPHIEPFHTFTAGLKGAPDLEYARLVAKHIRSQHHEIIPTLKEAIRVIPDVIYHLESFDAFVVRSSIMNFLVAKMAADYVPAVFSGEGGDELFAGYDYLKRLSFNDLPGQLIDITNRLHNTKLQRVDRCSAAHGTITYVGFLDADIVDYALRIPVEYKIFNGMEKWILRRAVFDLLPERVTLRRKEMFWEGAGIDDQIARFAAEQVTDADFRKYQQLPDHELINSKEELYYYRIFKEHYGSIKNLDWMGRTKESPQIQ